MHMTAEQLQGIAKRLKECRKSRHWTQEKTAEILDITYSSYSKIENGFQQPGIDLLIKISNTFSMPRDFLLFGKGERKFVELSEKQKDSIRDTIRILETLLED